MTTTNPMHAAHPPAGPTEPAGAPDRSAALIAGAAILVIAVLAAFGNFIAVQGLVTPDDAGRTARDIAASQTLFRLGIASLMVVVALDIVVAWALRGVFRDVHDGLSTLAAWLRLGYATVFMGAVGQLLPAARGMSDQGTTGSDSSGAQALVHIDAFNDLWQAALVLFGIHLLVVAVLAMRSGFVPSVVAALVAVAGAGYLFDSAAAVLVGDRSPVVSVYTFLGEFLLALVLVVRGARRSAG